MSGEEREIRRYRTHMHLNAANSSAVYRAAGDLCVHARLRVECTCEVWGRLLWRTDGETREAAMGD